MQSMPNYDFTNFNNLRFSSKYSYNYTLAVLILFYMATSHFHVIIYEIQHRSV